MTIQPITLEIFPDAILPKHVRTELALKTAGGLEFYINDIIPKHALGKRDVRPAVRRRIVQRLVSGIRSFGRDNGFRVENLPEVHKILTCALPCALALTKDKYFFMYHF